MAKARIYHRVFLNFFSFKEAPTVLFRLLKKNILKFLAHVFSKNQIRFVCGNKKDMYLSSSVGFFCFHETRGAAVQISTPRNCCFKMFEELSENCLRWSAFSLKFYTAVLHIVRKGVTPRPLFLTFFYIPPPFKTFFKVSPTPPADNQSAIIQHTNVPYTITLKTSISSNKPRTSKF